jgi:RNA-binding protein
MTAPARVPDTLDVTVHPEFVHQLAKPLDAGARHHGAQIVGLVAAPGLHAFQDGGGLRGQAMHTDRTAGWGFWPGRPGGGYNRQMPATLSPRDRASLKARAHRLAPVVRIGQARITPEVAAEVDRALTAHELIKVSIAVDDRAERRALGDTLAERLDASPVHRVGKILILWRRRAEDA